MYMYIYMYIQKERRKRERARKRGTHQQHSDTPKQFMGAGSALYKYIKICIYLYICVNAERGTHQCTYTYRYIAKPVQSSLSSFRPARTHEREPITNEREPIHVPRVCLYHTPACLRHLERRLGVF